MKQILLHSEVVCSQAGIVNAEVDCVIFLHGTQDLQKIIDLFYGNEDY